MSGERQVLRANHRRRNLKASEVIAAELANFIVDRDLPEGAMLPNEKDMVAEMGVGRTTLREALRLLETRGVITIKAGPRGGPVVRRPRPQDLSEALTLILQFEGASLAEVLDARRALEPMMARLAAERVTETQLVQLEATVTAILDNLDDHDLFLAENQKFHSLTAEAAGSVVLRAFSETVKSIADGAVVGVRYTPQRRKAVAEAHARIVAALRAGSAAGAEQAMQDHLDEAGTYWARKYGDLVKQSVRWIQ